MNLDTQWLRRKDVEKMTTLSKNTIYRFMNEGTFPKSLEVRPKIIVWVKSEVEEWMNEQILKARVA